jgi:hypothetical protein
VITATSPVIDTENISVHLNGGDRINLTQQLTLPASLPVGSYHIVAQVTPNTDFTPDQVDSGVRDLGTTYQVVNNAFGSIGFTSATVNVTDPVTGNPVGSGVVSLTGGGSGRYTVTPAGQVNLLLQGTTKRSVLSIQQSSGSFVVNTLTVTGNLSRIEAGGIPIQGNVNITGNVGSISVGDVSNGVWALSVGAGSLNINSLTSAQIFAGAFAGSDGIPGTADDTFGAAAIGSIFVANDVTSSLIVAGGAPADGVDIRNGIALLKGGKIGSVKVGSLSDDSKVLAKSLPSKALVGGNSVGTSGDPRFNVEA